VLSGHNQDPRLLSGRCHKRQPAADRQKGQQKMSEAKTGSASPAARKLVNYRAERGIAVLEMNDPPANAYSYEMMRDLDEAILQARFDDAVHVLILTGAGDKFFSAGANIQMLAAVTPRFKYFFCLHANETLNRLEQTPKLVIAALNGHTVGGGLEIALAADIRIARQGAGKIGLPEVALGVLPGTGGTQRLARLIGKARALELMALGATFPFEEAEKLGLVNHLCESENFLPRVLEYAAQFIPPTKAAQAVGHIKRAVQSGLDMPFESGLALERELQQQLFESADATEGLTAYLEKRQPSFKGK
jgi:enoyl-CoA hydratase